MTSIRTVTKSSWRSRGQLVYERLRRDIVEQRLEPGATLNEAELGTRYDASRTPVREALFRLAQDGFIVKSGRQLRVRNFSLDELEELYEIREALEKMAVRLCIERVPDEKLDEVRAQIDSYSTFDPETQYEAFNEYANQFHWTLAQLCGNQSIWTSLEAIRDKVLIITSRFLYRPNSFEETRVEHSTILQAIYERDVVVAEAAVRSHLRKVVRMYRSQAGQEMDRPRSGLDPRMAAVLGAVPDAEGASSAPRRKAASAVSRAS